MIIFVSISNFSVIKIVVGMRMTKLKQVNTSSSLVSFITVSLCRAQSLTQHRERERTAAQRLIMKSLKVFSSVRAALLKIKSTTYKLFFGIFFRTVLL